jgi:hypothetical protein
MNDNTKNNHHPAQSIAAMLTILVLLLAFPPSSQGKPQSILDYYLLLPNEYFICELSPKITREYKEKLIVRKNSKNGFIQASSEDYPMEVALFTDNKANPPLVAVNIRCGAGCMCNKFAVLSFSNKGKWNDVTAQVFPSDEQIGKALGRRAALYEFVLPEVGTTIKVVDIDTKKFLLNIYWSGGRFIIKF